MSKSPKPTRRKAKRKPLAEHLFRAQASFVRAIVASHKGQGLRTMAQSAGVSAATMMRLLHRHGYRSSYRRISWEILK